MPMDKKKVNQVRIRITEEKPNWTKIAEMEFDYKKWNPQPQPEPDKTELKQAIEEAKAAKDTDKYKNADADKKAAFDEALAKAEEVMADTAADEAAIKAAAGTLKAAAEALNGTTPPAPNPNPNPDPNPEPQPEPEYDLPLAPYVPEQPSEPTPAPTPAPAQPEVKIEEEQVALSSAESALAKELTKDMSKEEDKKLVEKILTKQIKYPEFVQKLSDKALEELAANIENHFKDETGSSWYAKELGVLRMLNLITGYEDGTFRGGNPVTGQEYLAVLIRAGQWELEKSEDTNWFAPYQKTAQKIGLLNSLVIDLTKEATREEIAALSYNFIVSMLEKTSASEEEIRFTDKEKIAEGYRQAVAYLTQKGILKGYEDGSFNPKKLVGRDEVVAVIYRLLAVLGK